MTEEQDWKFEGDKPHPCLYIPHQYCNRFPEMAIDVLHLEIERNLYRNAKETWTLESTQTVMLMGQEASEINFAKVVPYPGCPLH